MNTNAQTSQSMNIHFAPLMDMQWLWAIAIIGVVLFVVSFYRYRNGLVLRGLVFAAFILMLANPSLLKEERSYVKDVAVIVVDESASQKFGEREERTQTALTHLKSEIEKSNAVDLRIVKAPQTSGELSSRTDLFSSLDQTLSDVPQKQRAGVIFLSDGQIHDVPRNETLYETYGPVHALLSGKKNERDRQIIITNAPAYGLVGKDVTVKYRIEDTKNIGSNYANITLTLHDGSQKNLNVPIGVEQSLSIGLDHPSQNIFTLDVEKARDEITYANNKAAIIINGVRDRLKVLLVSGVPHPGERMWRDLLTSDPGVDLVHFTILREPQKFDYTPKNELSLIAFPFRELFEIKLYDFDLIIFDQYRVNHILPFHYFRNIVKYVKEGGAFLEASGPTFAGKKSIYDTPLGDILPARPTGSVIEEPYKPEITEFGAHHPVTKSLVWNNEAVQHGKPANWGQWMRYIDIDPTRGDVLMHAADDKPLLVLDRLEKGRVAQLSSDNIWLWSRGYDGGGPHAEMLRHIVHWLMKEPELDERAMEITVHNATISIRKQSYGKAEETIAMTTPNGDLSTLTLTANKDGLLRHDYKAEELGIYAFEDINGARKFAIIGTLDPLELRGVKTTAEKLAPLVNISKGATIWLDDVPTPKISISGAARRYGGSDWLALKRNNDFTVTGVQDSALLPEWFGVMLLLFTLLMLWWREGKG